MADDNQANGNGQSPATEVTGSEIGQQHLDRHTKRWELLTQKTSQLQAVENEIGELEKKKQELVISITQLQASLDKKEQEIQIKEEHLSALVQESEKFDKMVKEETEKQFQILDRILKKLSNIKQ